MQVTIHSVHFSADHKLKSYITEKLSSLSKYYSSPLEAHVFLKLENEGSRIKDKIVEVRMQMKGATLFASDQAKTFETAADSTADHLRRQLKKRIGRLRAK